MAMQEPQRAQAKPLPWLTKPTHIEYAYYLPRQEFDHDIHIDRKAEINGAGQADHRDPQRFRIDRDPVRRLLTVAVADNGLVQVVNRLFRPNRDHVAGAKLIAGAGNLNAVDKKMAVDNALPGLGARLC